MRSTSVPLNLVNGINTLVQGYPPGQIEIVSCTLALITVGVQSDLAIPDRAIADTLLYRMPTKPEVFVPAKFPCYTGCPILCTAIGPYNQLWEFIPWIVYKAHLLYRTTVDNEKNIGTHVEEIRESTELNYQPTIYGRKNTVMDPPICRYGSLFCGRLLHNCYYCIGWMLCGDYHA